MQTTIRKFRTLILIALVVMPTGAYAGGVEYLTNQSADYIRTFSRNAAWDNVDVVTFNPAASTFLGNGIHLSLSNQTLFGEYSATYKGKTYPADVLVPGLPSLQAAYVRDNWAAFVAFTIPSGGGSLDYAEGIPYLEPLATFASSSEAPTEGRFAGSSLNYGIMIGGAYKVLDVLSLSIGARVNIAKKSYEGEVTYGDKRAELDTQKDAVGVTGVFGLTLRPGFGLTFGARYELKTPMTFTSTTEAVNLVAQDTWAGTPLASFANDATEKRDMPGVLGLGFQWDAPLGWTVSVSYHRYFTEDADSAKDVPPSIPESGLGAYTRGWDDDYLDGWDLGVSVEYSFLSFVTVSVGYIRAVTGGNSDTYSDFEYALDSHSIGGGARVQFSKLFGVTLGVSRTFYSDGTGSLAVGFDKFDEIFKKSVIDVALGLHVSI
ncbi:MAG TPA: hypothetical protein DCQ06_09475 [Myxococcales bacterium]|nr:hypothetical protein [Myxococcales bacterium]HAN31813.1 hypothetical protein [Myxococcales bacterium]